MFGLGGGLANLGLGIGGSVLGGMFGDQSGAFDDASAAFRAQAARYDPWVKRGDEAAQTGLGEYNKLVQNPNFLQDMITKGFFVSPYQKEMENRVTQQMNMNAANSGMIESPSAQRALNDSIGNMTGQFMDNYINRGMQSYGQGLQGLNQTAQMGMGAMGAQDGLLEQGIGASLKGAQSSQGNMVNMFGNLVGAGMNYFNSPGAAGSMFANPQMPQSAAFGQSGIPYRNPASSTYNVGY